MKIDWQILEWIQDTFASPVMDMIMPKITVLGNAGIVWIVMSVCMIMTKKYRKTGILCLAGMFIGLIIGNGILKNVVMRERPCWIRADYPLLIPSPKDYSFPSGHTQASVIAAIIITLEHRKFGWVVIPLAVAIAFSRLYLYVHFPTDVMGGLVIGSAIGVLTYIYGNKLIKYIEKKRGITI